MQQPGTVSFRFISKMRLVSGPWPGRGWAGGVGWLLGRWGVSLWDAFAVPIPPFPRAGRDGGAPSAHAVSNLSLRGSVSSQSDSVCYVKAAFPLLGTILNRTTFKENSTNANKMMTVRKMYENIDENVDPCIRDEDDEEHAVRRYPPARRGGHVGLRAAGSEPALGAAWYPLGSLGGIRDAEPCPTRPAAVRNVL